ncbi:hypothetical protein RJT34_02861 [Clitoria ternatea]|uniref:Uncharacterized protein n=1 Tax=Clitoria ternatea TaxID=43366 RepID=A0AAN9KIP7_CLITE
MKYTSNCGISFAKISNVICPTPLCTGKTEFMVEITKHGSASTQLEAVSRSQYTVGIVFSFPKKSETTTISFSLNQKLLLCFLLFWLRYELRFEPRTSCINRGTFDFRSFDSNLANEYLM